MSISNNITTSEKAPTRGFSSYASVGRGRPEEPLRSHVHIAYFHCFSLHPNNKPMGNPTQTIIIDSYAIASPPPIPPYLLVPQNPDMMDSRVLHDIIKGNAPRQREFFR